MQKPLEGIQVLDLTAAWAGPLATRLLADMGARVIKVEGPTRPDLWRGRAGRGMAHRYPNRELGDRPFNRNSWFNTVNHDKYAITLDLKQSEGVEIGLELAAMSHVVISNFPPGVQARLGLGYDEVMKVRPDVIFVEMPAFGLTGPEASYSAWGPNLEASMGVAALQGYGDGIPIVTGYAVLDPIGGVFAASAVVTALMHWQRTGEGQHVEIAQLEASLQYIGEYLLQADDGQEVFPMSSNEIKAAAPHGAFRCKGPDSWVAIACFDETQWQRFCGAIGQPNLAYDPLFMSLADRQAHSSQLRERIEAWTIHQDKVEAANHLQSAGVPAAPVNDAADLSVDAHLQARGYFQDLTLADVGTHRYPGLPYRLQGAPRTPEWPSPPFGFHNREVLIGMLGISNERYEHLLARRVIADEPDK